MTAGLRFTSADLATLPDLPGVRYEIIDGDLHVSRQPQLGHQFAAGEVFRALQNWSADSGAGVAYNTPGLVFSEDNDVIPYIVWISRGRLAEAVDDHGHLRLSPELVVEVLSPGPANEVRDRDLKLGLYSGRPETRPHPSLALRAGGRPLPLRWARRDGPPLLAQRERVG